MPFRLLFATLVAVVIAASGDARAAEPISADAARDRALAGDIVLIDIRTPGEWRETGVADAAHALDMFDPEFIQKLERIVLANPGKPLAMICARGNRSQRVTEALEARGAIDILDVTEGMLGSSAGPGWLRRELPVRRPDQARVEAPAACGANETC